MYSLYCSFRTQLLCFWKQSDVLFLLPLFLSMTMLVACANTEDYANPLDSENLRTSGSPDGLSLFPGDKEVTVSWNKIEGEGVKEYRIYRREDSKTDEPFKLVGTVDATKNVFIDAQSIENDRRAPDGTNVEYEYRISYVDINDVETPDPTNPPDISADTIRIWPTATVTPSIAPPSPEVILGKPTDLQVNLIWEDYPFPTDFAMFRVYIALYEGPDVQLKFRKVQELTRDQFFYIDGSFRHDDTTKVYRIAAVDEFGVEGITEIRATSPNLPPAPPRNFRAFYSGRSLFNNKYDVLCIWDDNNNENDLAGYQIYSTDRENNIIPRRLLKPDETSVTIAAEDPIVIGGEFYLKTYFITAFDDTPTPDGKRDESIRVEAQLQ